jgi:hypothetical protein
MVGTQSRNIGNNLTKPCATPFAVCGNSEPFFVPAGAKRSVAITRMRRSTFLRHRSFCA